MTVLMSSTLTLLACQGCSSLAPDGHADVLALSQAEAVVVPSEGIRLATAGAFSDTITVKQRPVSTQLTFENVSMGPVPLTANVSANVSYDGEAPEPISWSSDLYVSTDRSGLSVTEWSGSESIQSFNGSLDAARILQPGLRGKDFNAAFELEATRAQTGLAFDVNVVPSVSYSEEGEFETRRFGAEVRVGREFDQRGSSAVADSWYVFAGTEGEALVWEAGEYGLTNVTGAMALRDQVTVGDLQAGVSFQRGQGQLSISYIRREVSWSDRNGGASEDEDFAGVSFTLRR